MPLSLCGLISHIFTGGIHTSCTWTQIWPHPIPPPICHLLLFWSDSQYNDATGCTLPGCCQQTGKSWCRINDSVVWTLPGRALCAARWSIVSKPQLHMNPGDLPLWLHAGLVRMDPNIVPTDWYSLHIIVCWGSLIRIHYTCSQLVGI